MSETHSSGDESVAIYCIVLRKFMNHGKKVSALDWMPKDMTNEIATH
jgi:hypothetical protein